MGNSKKAFSKSFHYNGGKVLTGNKRLALDMLIEYGEVLSIEEFLDESPRIRRSRAEKAMESLINEGFAKRLPNGAIELIVPES